MLKKSETKGQVIEHAIVFFISTEVWEMNLSLSLFWHHVNE
jgi:hypothetical protein